MGVRQLCCRFAAEARATAACNLPGGRERSRQAMIIETIFSTINEDGTPNFAPMGITWGEESLTVRPFRQTDTCRNLLTTGYGVANLTDDVLAYVRCALYDDILPHFPARAVPGVVFEGACSWRELRVVSQAGTNGRAELVCRVLYDGRQRDFLGFCRACNAVIEAAILATRVEICDRKMLDESLLRYAGIVEKTGGDSEKQAFQLVRDYVRQRGDQ